MVNNRNKELTRFNNVYAKFMFVALQHKYNLGNSEALTALTLGANWFYHITIIHRKGSYLYKKTK